MRHLALRPLMAVGSAVALACASTACANSNTTAPVTTQTRSATTLTLGTYVGGEIKVCKNASAPAGTYNFTISQAVPSNPDANAGTLPEGSTFTLGPGECTVAWVAHTPPTVIPDPAITVTVEEVDIPSGVQFDDVQVDVGDNGPTPSISGTTVTVKVNYVHGAVVSYFNSAVPTTGGQGCTPGYWKQPQHFDSWTSPYGPTTLFSDVFEDAFPDMTLEDVLSLHGGGLNALGRHTVSALLNAASPDVSYDYSVSDVTGAFNDAYPGTKADYTTLKDQFEAANTQTCPLN